MYTTADDVGKAGWQESGHNDGTLSHPDHSGRATIIIGDTGQAYVQMVGTSFQEKFDPTKHGPQNR
jgi:hypothetical protein